MILKLLAIASLVIVGLAGLVFVIVCVGILVEEKKRERD
jgi:hypothetical protein